MEMPMEMKMFHLIERFGSLDESEMKYFTNNLEPFVEFLQSQAVKRLTMLHGLDEQEADSLVRIPVKFAQMLGGLHYSDFLTTESLLEGAE